MWWNAIPQAFHHIPVVTLLPAGKAGGPVGSSDTTRKLVRRLGEQLPVIAGHRSGSSSGRAWARRRISSSITDAIVMAFRHDLALSGARSIPMTNISPPQLCNVVARRGRQS
jgi:hypothetical protein